MTKLRKSLRPVAALAVLLTALLAVLTAEAVTPLPVDEAFERAIRLQLEKLAPDAVPVFAEANAARDREDYARAAELYARVREMAPGFVHATRRQCGVENARGRRVEGLALCREALRTDDSPENRAALAHTLVSTPKGQKASETETTEALSLASSATVRKPNDFFMQTTLCSVAVAAANQPSLRECVGALERIADDKGATHYFATILAASEGNFDKAYKELELARAHGLPDDAYRAVRASLDKRPPAEQNWGNFASRVLVGWLGGFAVLLALGSILSGAALRSAARIPAAGAGGHPHGVDALLRKMYGAVLWLCCAYYYLSLPLLAVTVFALGAGAIYAFFIIGHVPIKLVAIVVVAVVWSLWAITKSVFVRVKDEDPGEKTPPSAHVRLDAAIREVAARIGTRPVDNVYLTPGTEIAVTERGGLLRQLRGASERALILGIGVLDGMTVRELKAIFAHEYGHFHNEDTAGGGFALTVRRSVLTMAMSLAKGGVAGPFNPAWWFVSGFYKVFLRISQGASRLQEVLADRWAVFTYGSEAFAGGLRHVIERSVSFDAHAEATLSEVVEHKRALANLYRYEPAKRPALAKLEEEVAKAILRNPSPYDSHPAPRDRFAAAKKLDAKGAEPSPDDDAPAWSLFTDRDTLERHMTGTVRANIRKAHSVEIAENDPT